MLVRRSLVAVLAVLSSGCASSPLPASPAAEGIVTAWHLAERRVDSIGDRWATAGDAVLFGEAMVLVYEAVYADARPVAETVPGPAGCGHAPRLSYGGSPRHGVGTRVEVAFSIEGPPGVAHVVEIGPSHPSIVIFDVLGATSLGGEPGRFVLAGEARAIVAFTSRAAGRGGLRIAVIREVSAPDDSEESFVRRR